MSSFNKAEEIVCEQCNAERNIDEEKITLM